MAQAQQVQGEEERRRLVEKFEKAMSMLREEGLGEKKAVELVGLIRELQPYWEEAWWNGLSISSVDVRIDEVGLKYGEWANWWVMRRATVSTGWDYNDLFLWRGWAIVVVNGTRYRNVVAVDGKEAEAIGKLLYCEERSCWRRELEVVVSWASRGRNAVFMVDFVSLVSTPEASYLIDERGPTTITKVGEAAGRALREFFSVP